jgi:hypothetical protein
MKKIEGKKIKNSYFEFIFAYSICINKNAYTCIRIFIDDL